MKQKELDSETTSALSEKLNSLACKDCVRDWLEKHVADNDPLDEIEYCAEKKLISRDLQRRLTSEVNEILRNL